MSRKSTTPRRAAIYVRLSVDRDGQAESPGRQHADCSKLAADRGYTVTETFEERNRSAYRGKRPVYDRLLTQVAAGDFDAVVIWKLDRATRGGVVSIAKLLEVLQAHRVELLSVNDPHLDTTSAMGRGVLSILGATAEAESDSISLRVKRAHRAAARSGKPHGGTRRFGYTADWRHEPTEVATLRRIHRWIVRDDWSPSRVCEELNARGLTTVTGGAWQRFPLVRMLRAPYLTGHRTHHGTRSRGTWTPVFTPAEHAELIAALDRRSNPNRKAASVSRHLLVGLLRCGVCGANLSTRPVRQRNGDYTSYYQCQHRPGDEHCGGTAVRKDRADAFIIERTLEFLGSGVVPRDGAHAVDVSELETRLAEDEAALEGLDDRLFFHRDITQERYDRQAAKLGERITTTRAELETAQQAQARRSSFTVPDNPERWWKRADLDQQRATLARAVDHIDLLPPVRPSGRRFDPERLVIHWNLEHFDWSGALDRAEAWWDNATDAERRAGEAAYAEMCARAAEQELEDDAMVA